eukprot:NODE_100_length_20777_cov_0.240884.p13 type:complete len:153 gc:universal NODE_100_length_20777_cov_0.240884:17940-18398(+)
MVKKKALPVEEESYEVESIVDHKVEKGKFLYFVKWKGYESTENTWELERNLSGCSEILDAYKNLMAVKSDVKNISSPKKSSSSSPKKRKNPVSKSPSKRNKKEDISWDENDVSMIKEMDRIDGGIEVTLILKKNHTVVKHMLDDCRYRCPQK